MEQFVTEPDSGSQLFSGDFATVEHDLQVAERAINAGCDILLLPTDLNGEAAAQYCDDYINRPDPSSTHHGSCGREC